MPLNELAIQRFLDILGHKVEDRVTKANGVAVSVAFDLYGCVQVVVNPGLDADGKPREQSWYDYNRLQVVGKRVMNPPDFLMRPETIASGGKGPAEKPLPRGT